MTKHPLEMTKAQRRTRAGAIAGRMAAIEAKLAGNADRRADPQSGDGVDPALESEWARLDTERRVIEALD